MELKRAFVVEFRNQSFIGCSLVNYNLFLAYAVYVTYTDRQVLFGRPTSRMQGMMALRLIVGAAGEARISRELTGSEWQAGAGLLWAVPERTSSVLAS